MTDAQWREREVAAAERAAAALERAAAALERLSSFPLPHGSAPARVTCKREWREFARLLFDVFEGKEFTASQVMDKCKLSTGLHRELRDTVRSCLENFGSDGDSLSLGWKLRQMSEAPDLGFVLQLVGKTNDDVNIWRISAGDETRKSSN